MTIINSHPELSSAPDAWAIISLDAVISPHEAERRIRAAAEPSASDTPLVEAHGYSSLHIVDAREPGFEESKVRAVPAGDPSDPESVYTFVVDPTGRTLHRTICGRTAAQTGILKGQTRPVTDVERLDPDVWCQRCLATARKKLQQPDASSGLQLVEGSGRTKRHIAKQDDRSDAQESRALCGMAYINTRVFRAPGSGASELRYRVVPDASLLNPDVWCKNCIRCAARAGEMKKRTDG